MKKPLIIFVLFIALGYFIIGWTIGNTGPPKLDASSLNSAAIAALESADKNTALNALTAELAKEIERVEAITRRRDRRLRVSLGVYITAAAMGVLCLYSYWERSVLKPFRKLQHFARNVAAGNLDIPLAMDRHGRFGAFSESFDLMREELSRAKEREREAERSKKELVASLSHDVKTPVASIKAVAEYMLLVSRNEEDRKQLEIINAKAEQINSLITNMFHSTLAELQALNVAAVDIQSSEIPALIRNADYAGRVQPFSIQSCIVSADPVRLQQVFDNIIGNSYKYAGTDIEINSFFEGQYLVIEAIDFGGGVPATELPLIMNKFYRGKDCGAKSGYGLGLYISKYLLAQMAGGIICENHPKGFCARLTLSLAN